MLQDILSGSTSLFADGVQTVLRGHENRQRRVVLLNGNLVGNVRSESRGISARVTKNGCHGFSSVASYTEEDAKAVITAATQNALFLDGRARVKRPGYPSLAGGNIMPKIPVNINKDHSRRKNALKIMHKRLIEIFRIKAYSLILDPKRNGKQNTFLAAKFSLKSS